MRTSPASYRISFVSGHPNQTRERIGQMSETVSSMATLGMALSSLVVLWATIHLAMRGDTAFWRFLTVLALMAVLLNATLERLN